MIQKCTVCCGAKKVMGMGYMSQLCENCDGLGFLNVELNKKLASDAAQDNAPKKRRGRPSSKKVEHS